MATGAHASWQAPGVTDHAETDDDELSKIPQETWDEFLRLVREGIYTQSSCMESLGYTRQAATMKAKREPEFRKLLTQAAAEGRNALVREMVDLAKKHGQWQALSRRLEIVHGELHPVDEAKVASLKRGEDPEFLRGVADSIARAFGSLPVPFERPPIDEQKPEPEAGEEPTE